MAGEIRIVVKCDGCGAPLHTSPLGLTGERRAEIEARPCASCSGLSRRALCDLVAELLAGHADVEAVAGYPDKVGEMIGLRRALVALARRSPIAREQLAATAFREVLAEAGVLSPAIREALDRSAEEDEGATCGACDGPLAEAAPVDLEDDHGDHPDRDAYDGPA